MVYILSLAIIFVIVILLLIFISIIIVPYEVHIEMNINSHNPFGYATFERFVKEFNKHNWNYDYIYKDSLFDNETNSWIHASEIMFNNKMMIMESLKDFRKQNKFVKQYIEKHFGNSKLGETIKW